MIGLLRQLQTVGHIPPKMSRHVYFFPKEENGQTDGTVQLMVYDGLQAITYPYWWIGDSTDFKFQKSPLCYTYENEEIPNLTLFIRVHSKRKRTIIIRRGDNCTHSGMIGER